MVKRKERLQAAADVFLAGSKILSNRAFDKDGLINVSRSLFPSLALQNSPFVLKNR